MDELVRVMIAVNEAEAELACGLLRGNGIDCMHRITDMAFGAGGEMPLSGGGAREVLVRAADATDARSLLAGVDDPSAASDGPGAGEAT